MRDLIESDEPRAKLAHRIYINRVVRYVGAYAAEMDGVDSIVFTAGIGEHDPGIRTGVMSSLKYLGLKADFEANRTDGEKFISKPNSKVKALIVPTNEEVMIAREVIKLTR
ncbi:acetate kinase [Lactobacillus helveticus]|nr:acetate kinase [Lactobacillus helveticus]MBW8038253.1 acetate kinase [Lactobacillus helveticus]